MLGEYGTSVEATKGKTLGRDLQTSGKARNLTPALPASLIQWIVFCTESSRSNHPGSAVTQAALYFLIRPGIFDVMCKCKVCSGSSGLDCSFWEEKGYIRLERREVMALFYL